jgi:secretion/DNA translocation related TadE-like protein
VNPIVRRGRALQERHRFDRGSATVWCVALMGLLFSVAMAFAYLGAARVTDHRAQSAADMSALAAAGRALVDPEDACSHAAHLAERNGARLLRCTIEDSIAEVTASVPLSLPGMKPSVALGRARAGPARIDPGRPVHSGPARPSDSNRPFL